MTSLEGEAARIRADIDDAINSGDGVPRGWWLRQQRERLALVEEQIREIEEAE